MISLTRFALYHSIIFEEHSILQSYNMLSFLFAFYVMLFLFAYFLSIRDSGERYPPSPGALIQTSPLAHQALAAGL